MTDHTVLLTDGELEIGVQTIELARLTGHAKPAPHLDADAAALERKLRHALEQPAGAPTISQIASALDVLERSRLVLLPGLPIDVAEQIEHMRSALEFYAEHGRNAQTGEPAYMRDGGARARAALRGQAVRT